MRDIYFTEEYVKLYENEVDHAFCIICESDRRIALLPFLRRCIGDYFDFETAYGYGGPIFSDNSKEWVTASLVAMEDFFSRNRYLCGFIRFHPLINNADNCKEIIDVIYDRKTISVNLEDSEENIWNNQITSKNRNMIRKAEKNELEFRCEYEYASINSFKELYNNTMMRLNAEGFYFFDAAYYDSFIRNINQNGFLGVVSLQGKIVGAALFMMYDHYGHYHLAGSDRNYSSLGINNILLWNTIKTMKQLGVTCFHLGGGTSSSVEDSLYKFKKSFSSNDNDFYIGKWIFNAKEYQKVCEDWETANPDLISVWGNRLLKYRYT